MKTPEEAIEAWYRPAKKRKSRRKTRPVVRIDFERDPPKLKSYESAYQAAERTGIAQPSISMACRGKRHTAGGYGWRYF